MSAEPIPVQFPAGSNLKYTSRAPSLSFRNAKFLHVWDVLQHGMAMIASAPAASGGYRSVISRVLRSFIPYFSFERTKPVSPLLAPVSAPGVVLTTRKIAAQVSPPATACSTARIAFAATAVFDEFIPIHYALKWPKRILGLAKSSSSTTTQNATLEPLRNYRNRGVSAYRRGQMSAGRLDELI